jgi:hypothetical protein
MEPFSQPDSRKQRQAVDSARRHDIERHVEAMGWVRDVSRRCARRADASSTCPACEGVGKVVGLRDHIGWISYEEFARRYLVHVAPMLPSRPMPSRAAPLSI